MALMILKKLPTESDVEQLSGMELGSFVEAFDANTVAPFVAKVKIEDDIIELDEWQWPLRESDWYSIVTEE